ncbi:LytTR family transcriptional regulator DNA-binding domain-containing protein [Sphingobacterium sp. BIGb0165]|uniref:LytTR family transcriptional regulator DNA-binding domain-containing protein n=1 Tax=Sphingobacterium sp. BIGb0165 TaxID=2940615 RepID=UPI0038F61977
MKEIIGQLPADRFSQVHLSYIVSHTHIDSLIRNHITIGTAIIPISTSRKTTFFTMWEEWHR